MHKKERVHTTFVSFISVASTLAAMIAAGDAGASGFQIREQGTSGQGTSFAGATSSAKDLSTIYFNPAGMTYFSKRAAQAELALILPSAKFKDAGSNVNFRPTGGTGGDAGSLAIVPSAYSMYALGPDLRVGLGINAPFGLKTEYDADWMGRFLAIESELKTINAQPTVAYRFGPKLSIGGGLNIQYADATLIQGVNAGVGEGRAELSGDDWGFGYTVGLMFQPTNSTRLGVTYKSRIRHILKGDVRYSGTLPAGSNFQNTDASVDLSTPDMFSLGVTHHLSPRWTVMAEGSHTNWSVFDEIRVRKELAGTQDIVTEEDWRDSWLFALGTEYKFNNRLDLRFGVAYDQSPVRDQYRSPRIPDSDRVWASLGAGYALTDTVMVNAAYTHIWNDDARVDKSVSAPLPTDRLRGEYDSSVDIVTLNLSTAF